MKKLLLIFILFTLNLAQAQYLNDASEGSYDLLSPTETNFTIPMKLDLAGQLTFGLPDAVSEYLKIPSQFLPSNAYPMGVLPFYYYQSLGRKRIIALVPPLEGMNHLALRTKDEHGYLVQETKELNLGLGLNAQVPLGPSGFSAGVGLVPIKGSKISVTRTVDSKEELDDLTKFKRLKRVEDLEKLKIGDSLSYRRKGGVVFKAFISHALANVGVHFAVRGIWQIKIKKGKDHKFFAQINNIKVTTMKQILGTLISGAALSQYNVKDENFSFIFDLKKTEARLTFKRFLKGDILSSQKKVKEEFSGVQMLSVGMSGSIGKTRQVGVGIPLIFNYGRTYADIQSFSKTHVLSKDKKINTVSGLYVREMTTDSVLSHNSRRFEIFAAQLFKVRKGTQVKTGFGGQYKYIYETEKFNSKKLQREMRRLQYITGLEYAFNWKAIHDDLGYARIEFNMDLSQEGSLKLMREALSQSKEQFVSSFMVKVKASLKSLKKNRRRFKKYCKSLKSEYFCRKSFYRSALIEGYRTKKAFKKMYDALKKMNIYWQNNNGKGWTESYAKVGKSALKNEYTFQALMGFLGKENLKMGLSLKGEKIYPLFKNL